MRKNKKTIIIALLFLVVVGMGVGYSILSKQLKIEGTATIATNLDVAITGITRVSNASTSKYYNPTSNIYQNFLLSTDEVYYNTTVENASPEFTSTTATFDVTFNNKNDSITYVVDICNQGESRAILDEIVVEKEGTNSVMVTPLYDYVEKKISISQNETIRYFVTFSYPQYSDVIGDPTSNITIKFTFKQYTAVASSGGTNYLLTFGDELSQDNQLSLFINGIKDSVCENLNLYVSIDEGDFVNSGISSNLSCTEKKLQDVINYSIPSSLNDGELHTIKFKLGTGDSSLSNEIELKYQN